MTLLDADEVCLVTPQHHLHYVYSYNTRYFLGSPWTIRNIGFTGCADLDHPIPEPHLHFYRTNLPLSLDKAILIQTGSLWFIHTDLPACSEAFDNTLTLEREQKFVLTDNETDYGAFKILSTSGSQFWIAPPLLLTHCTSLR